MVFLNVNLLLRRAAMDIRLNATPVTLKNAMTCFLRISVSVDNQSGCVDISFITATIAFEMCLNVGCLLLTDRQREVILTH